MSSQKSEIVINLKSPSQPVQGAQELNTENTNPQTRKPFESHLCCWIGFTIVWHGAFAAFITILQIQDFCMLFWQHLTIMAPYLFLSWALLLIFQDDERITLSTASQTIHIDRSGPFTFHTILPLDQVTFFSSRNHITIDDNDEQHRSEYICMESVGPVIALGYLTSPIENPITYDNTVNLLNQFLTQSRRRNASPTPYTPLRDSQQRRFQLTSASPVATQLPSLSPLSFRNVNETSFICVDAVGLSKRDCPFLAFLFLGTSLLNWIITVLVSFLVGPTKSLSVFVNDVHVIAGVTLHFILIIIDIIIPILKIKLRRRTWIFSTESLRSCGMRKLFDWLRRVIHVPVNIYNRVEVEKYEGVNRPSCPHFWHRRPTTQVYNVHFIADTGRTKSIYGLAEGEVLCLSFWLKQRFPCLLENRIENGGEDDDGLVELESESSAELD